MAIGSAIKTIRWERPEGEESTEVEMDMDSSDDDDPQEAVDDGNDGEGNILEAEEEDPEAEYDQSYSRRTVKSAKRQADRGEGLAGQALPVAELPEDFDYNGEVQDGATFLALSIRANAALPPSKRHHMPESRAEPVLPQQPVASGSRHPALPAETWTTVFPDHFRNYRSYIRSEWPPEPLVPYPEHLPRRPNAYSRGEVWLYVNGHKRKWLQYDAGPDGLPIIPNDKGKGKGKGKAKDNEQTREDEEWGINAEDMDDDVEPEVEEEADMDLEIDEEEAAMNGPKKVLIKVLEDEEEKHQKHEPLVCVLQHYDTHQLISIIELITTFASEKLDLLSPFVLVPSTPESSTTPLPTLYSCWLFACLILIDDQLDSHHMAAIRDLARCAMKVAAWRWIQAVTDKEVDASESASWAFRGADERDKGENGLEETLGRCWLLVHAVVAGWNQRDLLDDLENMFR